MRTVEFEVMQANATTYECDVLMLKYAQEFHGLDRRIAHDLKEMGVSEAHLQPKVGQAALISSRGQMGARDVLFVGTVPINEFEYNDIQQLIVDGLRVMKEIKLEVRHLAITLHGPNAGLDELEAALAEAAGIDEAVRSGKIPDDLQRITIVDRDAQRVIRMRQLFQDRGIYGFTPLSSHFSTRGINLGSRHKNMDEAASNPDNESLVGRSPLVFVAMPFDPSMDDVFHYGIQQPVRHAGFICERMDQVVFTGDILSRVKSRIKSASLIIADLTSGNANVYLEVGYAWGLNRPTLLLAKKGEELKFDVQGQRCVFYTSIHELELALAETISQLRANGEI